MTTAFVFSGGASLGSIQVGMAIALEENEIKPDLVIRTSVGAINAAWFAGQRPADELADVWRSLRRSQLFPLRPLAGLRGFLGNTSHFVPNSGVRRLLRKHVRFERLEDAPIPFKVIAADARTGEEVVLSHGLAIDSIVASSALPAIFPPVEVNGQLLIDGGVANNTPRLSAAT